MKLQIALIGYGAIGAAVHRLLLAHADQVEVVSVLVRDRAAAQTTPVDHHRRRPGTPER